MEVQDNYNNSFFSGDFMQTVIRYKKHLLAIGVIAVILSSIFSSPFFITPLYKSVVILYPTASKSISKALLAETFGNTKDILEFGEEEQTEQMLQVLNSNKIRDRVIVKYNLLDHYDISPDSKYKMTELFKEYESNFIFRRTEYMAVKITVYDRDAQLAADMANDIAELVDSTINRMQKDVAIRAFHIVEAEYKSLKREVQVMEDSLTKLREFGVNDYESQAEMFNMQLAIEMAKGNVEGVKRLEKKLEILAKYGGPYVSIRDALEYDKKQLSEIKARYDEAKVDATQNLPHKFIVSDAYKAERKSYPIRWVIVLITTISALFLAILILGGMNSLNGKFVLDVKKKTEPLPVKNKLKVQEDNRSEKRIKPANENAEESRKERTVVESEPVKKQEPQIIIQEKIVYVEKEVSKKENSKSLEDNNNIEMDNFFNSSNLLKLVDKWKYHLLVIVGVAAILAGIFSGPTFITPMYKSYAVAYPANIEPYSEESETEQMLQIINSQEIIDSVIEKFDLAKHYEIDKDYVYWRTTLLYEYHQNIGISKTPYESVLIEVLDKNPDTAMLIVNAILHYYNSKVSEMHKGKYREVVEMYKNQMAFKQRSLDSLKMILHNLGSEYGLIDYSVQSQEIMRGYLKTLTGDGPQRVNDKEVSRLLENMELQGGQLLQVMEMITHESRTFVDMKVDYELAYRFLNADMTYSNIVTSPFVADKKSYPVRWLIVVVVTLAVFVFSMLIILFIEKRKKA